MREFKIIIILFFVVIATSCGQQKKYISYTVKKGETLKIIAKRIGIKTKELMRLNPDTGRKPAAETLIIIPNNGYKSPIANNILDKLNDSITTEANIVVKDTLVNTFVLHKVSKG
ncbi:LysM peptidoglycan-binding domain-containing protein, partial [Flavobacteriaceae bacterium]|nr:LysM peptidoglycan-binding domain-containing protein [Flavobacteriaceae bacterium]